MLEIGAQVLSRGNLQKAHLQMVSPSASERGVGSQNVIHLLGSTVHHLLSVPLLGAGLREEAFRTGTRTGIQATGVTLNARLDDALGAHPGEGALQGTTGGEEAFHGVQMGSAEV